MTATSPSSIGETDRLASGYSGRILLVVALCSIVSNLGWLLLPPLLPLIIDDLGITATQAGVALTLLTGLSALCRYPGGRLADKLSRKTMIAAAITAWALGFLTLAVATNYALFVVGVSLVGIGLGTYVPAAFAQLSDLFDRKQGRAFGINNAAFNLGGILASGAAVVAIALGRWRLAFLPIVAVLVGLFALSHRWNRERYVIERVDIELRETIGRLLLEPRALTVLIVAALISFVWNGSISFLPTFLDAERGLTTRTANVAYAAVFATGVIATPLSGAVGDRIGSLRTILGTICFTIVGLASVIVLPSTVGVLVGVVCFAIGLTGFWPVMTAYMMTAFPDDSKGGDYGAVGAVYMGVGSLGPTYVGVVGQRIHYTAAYTGLVGCLFVCLAVLLWLRRR